MHKGPCSTFSKIIYSTIVRISAMPALSSAPSMVVPSEVIRVLPFKLSRCGKSLRLRVSPLFPSLSSPPS